MNCAPTTALRLVGHPLQRMSRAFRVSVLPLLFSPLPVAGTHSFGVGEGGGEGEVSSYEYADGDNSLRGPNSLSLLGNTPAQVPPISSVVPTGAVAWSSSIAQPSFGVSTSSAHWLRNFTLLYSGRL